MTYLDYMTGISSVSAAFFITGILSVDVSMRKTEGTDNTTHLPGMIINEKSSLRFGAGPSKQDPGLDLRCAVM